MKSVWVPALLAMVLSLTVSTGRMYLYLDGVLRNYAQSFRVDVSDHFVYWSFHTRELQKAIDSLNEKRSELEKKEESLQNWQVQLENQKKELADSRAQLDNLKANISALIVQTREDEVKNLKSLSATYSAIAPDAAVGILNELDENTVVKLLALMKADTVGPIFEAMSKLPGQETQMRARIARLSEKLRLYRQALAPSNNG